ncbi:hypothetical protein N6H14_07975 [Paenibacillus sp. CC-CFT747]|nr:hypothetical protein N6H14_07975 [Paenibacillus sp. CC-CFT747]
MSNSSVLFSILWSYLIFHEPITLYVVTGTLVFLAGFLLLNLPGRRQAPCPKPVKRSRANDVRRAGGPG